MSIAPRNGPCLFSAALCFLLGVGAGRGVSPLALLLIDIVVGAFFTALLSMVQYLTKREAELPLIEFWLLVSVATTLHGDAPMLVALILPAGGGLMALRWRLNLLTLGDDEARSLGIKAGRLRLIVVALATLIVADIVGQVWLVVPHAAWLLVGTDTRRRLPASASMGPCYLLFIDDLARGITVGEVLIGVLTALIGAPVFVVLLRRGGSGWAGSLTSKTPATRDPAGARPCAT